VDVVYPEDDEADEPAEDYLIPMRILKRHGSRCHLHPCSHR
jgi:hypothetical protein